MKTRLVLYGFACFALIAIVYGCKKDFLDRKPKGQYVIETYFTTDKRALEGVVGVYDPMGWERTFDKMFWALGDGATDDNPFGLTRDDGTAPFIGINSVADYSNVKNAALSPAFEVMYKGYYEGIYRANLVINALTNQETTIDADLKKRLVAECRSLRGLYYFMLVNYYGGVPLFTDAIDPLDPASAKLPRASKEQVYEQIVKDLTESIQDLPTKSATAAENMVGRITKGAAYGLLAKSYLYQKKYAEAVAAANQVMALNEYSLNADYFDNFRQSNPNGGESLWEIQHNDNATVDNGGGWGADSFDGSTAAVKMQACNGGWGQNRPSADLYNAFEEGDTRRKYVAATESDDIDGVTMCGTPENPSMAKFIVLGKGSGTLTPRDDVSPINRVLIRLADVMMVKAEALAAAAGTAAAPGEAIDILVAIRTRAGLSSPSAATFATYTSEELLRFIRAERRKEFGMEGWRLFDLRRWGADSARTALARVGKVNTSSRPWNDAYLLFPIPQSEIDLSGGAVEQNPGY